MSHSILDNFYLLLNIFSFCSDSIPIILVKLFCPNFVSLDDLQLSRYCLGYIEGLVFTN